MRSLTWITILVGLFMFQSIWNVAAAFCVHENIDVHVLNSNTRDSHQDISGLKVPIQHFGHHDAYFHASHGVEQSVQDVQTDLSQSTYSDVQLLNSLDIFNQQNTQAFLDFNYDDHTDHLPSMGHLILSIVKHLDTVVWYVHSETPDYFWLNAYESPDLFYYSPPPELSPLMVG